MGTPVGACVGASVGRTGVGASVGAPVGASVGCLSRRFRWRLSGYSGRCLSWCSSGESSSWRLSR